MSQSGGSWGRDSASSLNRSLAASMMSADNSAMALQKYGSKIGDSRSRSEGDNYAVISLPLMLRVCLSLGRSSAGLAVRPPPRRLASFIKEQR